MTNGINSKRIAILITVPLGLLFLTIGYAQTDKEGLAELSDVALFLHEDREAARAILDRRMEGYTPAEKAKFQDDLMSEIDRRRKNRKPLDADELLERIRAAPYDYTGTHAPTKLRELFERSNETERAAIRERFMADWELVTYPSLTDEGPSAGEEGTRFMTYLKLAPSLYDNEADFIAMLERRCLNRGIEGEMTLFLQGLQAQGDAAGPLTAARIEQYFNEYRTWGIPEIGYADQGDMLPYMYTTLARCGRDGLDVLVRLGKTTTDRGVSVLGSLDVPETEAMLWSIYQNTEDQHISSKARILRAIQTKQMRQPTDERRDRIRQELVRFLSIPEKPFHLSALDKAIHAAGFTGDAWFIPHLDALEAELRNLDISETSEFVNNPENAARWKQNVLDNIENYRSKLKKAES